MTTAQEKFAMALPVGIRSRGVEDGQNFIVPEYEFVPDGVRPIEFTHALLQRRDPDLLRQCYPRIYERCDKWASPKDVCTMLALSLFTPKVLGVDASPTTYRLMLPSMSALLAQRVPLMFIAPALLDAVLRTDFQDEIDWSQMKLPWEQAVFVLPRGVIRHSNGDEVGFVFYGRQQRNPHTAVPIVVQETGKRFVDNLQHRFVFAAGCPQAQNLSWYDSNITMENRPTIRFGQMFWEGNEYITHGVNSRWESQMTREDAGFVEVLGRVLFGTLLAMTARPELTGQARLISAVPANPKKNRPAREFWSPNIIGEHYAARRVVQQHNAQQGGTHASPRLHWRRGHYRNQPCGAGRTERKVIWLEPTLVGAATVEEQK